MELALSLGDTPNKPFCKSKKILGTDLGFCMAVGIVCGANGENNGTSKETGFYEDERRTTSNSSDRPPVQLDLLPFSPVHRTQPPSSSNKFPHFPWFNQTLVCKPVVNRRVDEATEEGVPRISSPNSTVSSFHQMDFSIFRGAIKANNNMNEEVRSIRASSSRVSDEEEEEEDENGNNISRKKLRLTKEQSAFLEESFKEHNTLNPKQKLALAKQLNLRPRQVEVWFQNRRARTKLKQTEVDCEYLKRWCETLTEEKRKLQREVQELRALKAASKPPFYMQHPPTTLTMCPSCERVVTTTTTTTSAAAAAVANKPANFLSPSTANAHDHQHYSTC